MGPGAQGRLALFLFAAATSLWRAGCRDLVRQSTANRYVSHCGAARFPAYAKWMARFRRNSRVVALVIYALLVNLAWFAAASAHHIDFADAFCAQSTAAEGHGLAPQGSTHDACHQFCGANGTAIASPTVASIAAPSVGMPRSAVETAVDALVRPMAWQARAPPLG